MHNKTIHILSGIIMYFSVQCVYAQTEIQTITYIDNYTNNINTENILRSISDKSERVSSNAGQFSINLDNVPDSIATCVYVAVDIWESVLNNEEPVYLKFFYTEQDEDIQIEVSNIRADNNTFYPTSLHYNKNTTRSRTSDDYNDAKIYINKNVAWDCSHNDNILIGTKNMTYAILRSIAVSLGIGSSVVEKTGGFIGFSVGSRCYTVFDRLIISSTGVKLSDLTNIGNRKNTALDNFVQRAEGGNIFVKDTLSISRKMYAPNVYEPFKSLIYLDNENSLMHYDLNEGDKYLQIDTTTINMLKELGWIMQPTKKAEIVGVGIDESGIASAYENHSFQIQNNTENNITNIDWTYCLPLKNGNDSIICESSNTMSFNIPRIDNADKYHVNINGDIYGMIYFSGLINGELVTDSYRISLELKPKIKNVTILRKESNAPLYSYNLYYTVEYTGSDNLTISIEEEYSPELRTAFIREPFLAHVVSKKIASEYYAWVDITVRNQYGSDIYTIELPPYNNNIRTADVNSIPCEIYTHIDVYDIYGKQVGSVLTVDDMVDYDNGMYILNYYNDNVPVKTVKYLKR